MMKLLSIVSVLSVCGLISCAPSPQQPSADAQLNNLVGVLE